jgi:hypothetical protein
MYYPTIPASAQATVLYFAKFWPIFMVYHSIPHGK